MIPTIAFLTVLGFVNALALPSDRHEIGKPGIQVQPFSIDLSSEVPRLLQLINDTRLPATSEYPGASAGITLDALESLRGQWLSQYSWDREQEKLNQ
jgi:hypothetical protein